MHILVVGLNYRTAPVEVREKFAFVQEELAQALANLKATKSILEGVIVGTCNRTEVYAVVDRLHMCGHFIRNFLENWFDIPRAEFTRYLYIYEDDDAIRHLFRVTAGLDSMIIGETQILGQVRNAFLLAQQERATGTMFNTLFKQVVTMAKRAHSETMIAENAVSVSYAAVELGKRIFGNFNNKRVLIAGAGKMSELTVKHLRANGAQQVIVVNRTMERAELLARQIQGQARPMHELPQLLAEVDIVISSTGANDYVLHANDVERATRKRRGAEPLVLIDIAVPRDLDPKIADVSNVFLYDIDDLEGIVESNLEQRKREAVKIEQMIEIEMEAFAAWYRTLGVGPVIRALQERSAVIHEETMESLSKKLPELNERELKVIRKLTKSIANQMVHEPIARIKEMAAQKHGDEALRMFTHVFALEERVKQLESENALLKNKQTPELPEPAAEALWTPLVSDVRMHHKALVRS